VTKQNTTKQQNTTKPAKSNEQIQKQKQKTNAFFSLLCLPQKVEAQ
jgi:hypothetical protein